MDWEQSTIMLSLQIRKLIFNYWDFCCSKGGKQTILDYEFAIETGASPPFRCKKLYYDLHKYAIIMEQVTDLLASD